MAIQPARPWVVQSVAESLSAVKRRSKPKKINPMTVDLLKKALSEEAALVVGAYRSKTQTLKERSCSVKYKQPRG